MPEPGQTMTPIGRISSMRSLRLNGAALPWRDHSGLKTICGVLRLSAQQAAMRSAPFGDPPWSSTMWEVASEGLVEPFPDQAMVVEIEPAGEGDLGAGGNERFGLDAAFGGEEVAAVDHRRGQRAVGHRGTGAWPPGRPGVRLEAGGGRVAELFQALAPFDECRALADQAFEFDRADFRAVLFLLAAFLRLLVGIERALDVGRGAMEAVDRRPEQDL